jgi:hypothetical protein
VADNDRRIVVEGVEFAQLVQFPRILRAVTASFQPPRLVLGVLLVAALMTVGRIWDSVTTPAISPQGLTAPAWSGEDTQDILRAALAEYGSPAEEPGEELGASEVLEQVHAGYRDLRKTLTGQLSETEDPSESLATADQAYIDTVRRLEGVRPRGIFEATVTHVTAGFNRMVEGLVTLRLGDFFGGAADLFVRTPIALWNHSWIFTLAYGLLFVVVIAIGGGALCRMTAIETAYGEKLRLQEALAFALGSWRRLIFCLLLPLLIAAVLCAVLLIGGFFLMLPWVDLLGGLLYGIALLVGFGVVFLMVGYALGFSLLVPAVACENCDAADAQQRAYAYVLSRPLHLIGYGVVGVVGLAIGFVLASLFAVAILRVTGGLVDAVTANPAVAGAYKFELFNLAPDSTASVPLAAHSAWSAWLVTFWQTVVVCLVAGYAIANYFGGSTIIYLLMRRACDGQEITEVWQPGVVPGTEGDETVEREHDEEPVSGEGER